MSEIGFDSTVPPRNLFALHAELENLKEAGAMRRDDLLINAARKSKLKKSLSIASGILALLSAGAITTALLTFIGNTGLQVTAAISAAISGIISLVVTSFLADDDIAKMFVGSSKYLALRNRVSRLLLNPNITDDEQFVLFSTLQEEYALLDETYSKYYSSSFGYRYASYSTYKPKHTEVSIELDRFDLE